MKQVSSKSIEEAVLTSLFSEILKAVPSSIGKVAEWTASKNKERDFFGVFAKKYKKKLNDSYDWVRILGMEKPIPLRKIFVRVSILEKITSRQRLSVESLEKQFERDRRSFGLSLETMDGIDLFGKRTFDVRGVRDDDLEKRVPINLLDKIHTITPSTIRGKDTFDKLIIEKIGFDNFVECGECLSERLEVVAPKYIVLGKPGSGKTTYLKSLALQSLDGKTESKKIPIFVSLKEFSETKLSLFDFITHQFDICNFSDANDFVKLMLEKGKAIVLFDGLDEVSDIYQDEVIKGLKEFTWKHDKNSFVISCRTAAYNHWFPRFTDIEIADFAEGQIEEFVRLWFLSEPERGAMCWNLLRDTPQIRELGTSPLLLTLLCLAFEQNLDFPLNRSELYKEGLDALLKKWDASRRIKRELIYKNLSLKRKESLLSRLAFETFNRGMYFIPQMQFEKHIAQFISNLPDTIDSSVEVDSEAILKAIEAQHGILVERANGIYSFSHLTFQEYFTAKYLVEASQNQQWKQITQLEFLQNVRWREVILLTAELLDLADELLLSMDRECTSLAHSEQIGTLLTSIDDIAKDYENHNRTFVRAFVLDKLVWGIKETPLQHLTLELVSKLTRLMSVDNTMLLWLELNLEYGRLETFQREVLKYSQSFEKYLKLVLLIIDTLLTKCYINRETRQFIVARLLVAKTHTQTNKSY